MDEQLLTIYADICEQIKLLEDQKKSVGEEVKAHLIELKADKIQSPIGTFSLTERTTWTYTREVDCAKEEMEAIKREEEKNKKATAKITQSLRFQGIKNEE